MGIALYRKYRSKNLKEIIGQEHITTTLSNAIKTNQLSHAYLFTGPRGVGKTSVARILAHEVNNLPYTDDDNYLDIIEIDAASNRRIDEIRQLRERINLAPTNAKYKVYIIDEVHMLTREAFNALLKTLEEPPEHVIFILATTEAYKVPETIISRTQQFTFKPISSSQMAIQLKKIAKIEKIDIDDPATNVIAEYGEGSFRDSLSLLDQASSMGDKITEEDIDKLLGMAPAAVINTILGSVIDGSPKILFETLDKLHANGYNISVVSKQVLTKLRNSLTDDSVKLPDSLKLDLMSRLIEIPISNDPDTLFEIVMLSSIVKRSAKDGAVVAEEEIIASPEPEKPVIAESEVKAPEVVESKEVKKPEKKSKATLEFDQKIWPEVLNAIRSKHNTLYGVARMASPSVDGDTLTLTTKFEFHEKALRDEKNKKIISDVIYNITGKSVTIVLIVDKKLELDVVSEDKNEDDKSLSTINDIFGSSEVLE